MAVQLDVRPALRPGPEQRHRRPGLASRARVPGHHHAAQRDVRRGQRHRRPGAEHLRDPGAQLLLPRQDGARQHRRAVAAGRHPGRGQQRDRRGTRHRPGFHAEDPRRHPARAAAGRAVRGAAVLVVLRPEDRHRQARGLRQALALHRLRVRTPAVPVGVRGELAAARGRERPRRHGSHHRRLRRADDLPGRPAVQPRPPAAAVHPGPVPQITPGPDGYDLENDCGPQGWYGEETLDVEAVHAMAPGAKIVYVGAADCESGLDNAWARAIDNHVANVITNSWGRRDRRHQPARLGLRRLLRAVLAGGGADRDHGQLLVRRHR